MGHSAGVVAGCGAGAGLLKTAPSNTVPPSSSCSLLADDGRSVSSPKGDEAGTLAGSGELRPRSVGAENSAKGSTWFALFSSNLVLHLVQTVAPGLLGQPHFLHLI